MKKMLVINSALLIGFMFLLAVTTTSCKKETECTAIITVLNNSTGAPIVGATVVLDCQSCVGTGNLQTDQQTTDASGKTEHVFQYPAVLDVHITFQSTTVDGIIKLEEGETVNKTFKI
jgi:hypothetical protein